MLNFDKNCDNATNNINEEINSRITENEIKSTIKNLKNNKASGIDLILNEHLKSLAHFSCISKFIQFSIGYRTSSRMLASRYDQTNFQKQR